MLFGLFEFLGSVDVKVQKDGDIIISGITTENVMLDIFSVWRNNKIAKFLFKKVKKYAFVIDPFFLPDVYYIFSQIAELKKKNTNTYRCKKIMELINKNTWMKSTVEEHENILDFSQLNNLKHSLYTHQVDTLKQYNTKVPQMQVKGFLLSTPPGCLSGDTEVSFIRNGISETYTLEKACDSFQQIGDKTKYWDLSIKTYVNSFNGIGIVSHEIHSIVYSGKQDIYLVKLENGITIKGTLLHKVMTAQGYISIQSLSGHSVMYTSDNKTYSYVKVEKITYLGYIDTYDIICREPFHNFVANNIVVHNSGKTIMSIALSQCLRADVSFYIVPKNTVTTVWYDGIKEELPNARIWSSDEDDVPLTTDYDHYIFHYEALQKAIDIAKQLKNRNKSFIAIDESHNLNEIVSQRTLKLVELTKVLNCQNTVFASGTPIKAVGTEAIPLLRCIDPLFTPEVEERFKNIFGLSAKRANDILRNRLGLISHKILESSYMTAPKPIDIDYPVEIPKPDKYLLKTIKNEMSTYMKDKYKFYQSNMKQYTVTYNKAISIYEKTLKTSQEKQELNTYKKYVEIIIRNYDPLLHRAEAKYCKDFEKQKIMPSLPQAMKQSFKDATSVVKYAKLKVLGEALGIIAKRRAECAADLVRYGKLETIVEEADKKTIIFSSYIEALEVGLKYFQNIGYNALPIYGQYTKDLRDRVVKFKTDSTVNPLLATLQSLSASQTLTNASVVIFLNHPFRDYIRDQAFHRVFRIGQDVQTYIYTVKLETKEPNITDKNSEILDWSKEQVEAILGPVDAKSLDGIVDRLQLNPVSTSFFADMTQRFRDLF